MPATLPAGPYRVLRTVEGQALPYYVLPFDGDGVCTGPQTAQHLLDAAHGYSDIFLFSHGWNNDWAAATQRYEAFIQGVQSLRREYHLPAPPGYKPLLVGIFWPSQALAWFESEVGPGFAAGGDPALQAAQADLLQGVLQDVAAALPKASRARFFELATASALQPPEAQELAALLAGATHADSEEGRAAPTAQDLLAAASSLAAPEPDYDAVGTADAAPAAPGAGPSAAFGFGDLLGALDPRNLIKPFTVWQMKDRAGVVGHDGVAPVLLSLLQRSAARVHLLGHSYGCKVVMTALCTPPTLPRLVESALLLQPAVSQYAFAAEVPDVGVAGGFARARQRVRQPIVATYSANDVPLTKLFHVSVRRSDDLGELQFAGEGSSPSRYAAMGGYGPQASQARFVSMQDPGDAYTMGATGQLLAVNGTRCISGHGDINGPATWWLSYLLATAHQQTT